MPTNKPTNKKDKLIYWLVTFLAIVPPALSGIPELFTAGPESVTQSMQTLGYPLYLMKILGFWKILGAIAIFTGRSRWLKEWAYAGYTFLLTGATASHLLASDFAHAPFPFVFFLFLVGSYFYWTKKEI